MTNLVNAWPFVARPLPVWANEITILLALTLNDLYSRPEYSISHHIREHGQPMPIALPRLVCWVGGDAAFLIENVDKVGLES
jgi:hypothetical protein